MISSTSGVAPVSITTRRTDPAVLLCANYH